MATLLEYDEHVVNPRFYGTAPGLSSKSRPAFAGPMRSEMVSSTIGVKGHVLGTYDRHVLSDRDGGGTRWTQHTRRPAARLGRPPYGRRKGPINWDEMIERGSV